MRAPLGHWKLGFLDIVGDIAGAPFLDVHESHTASVDERG